jgi:hypothetical protein
MRDSRRTGSENGGDDDGGDGDMLLAIAMHRGPCGGGRWRDTGGHPRLACWVVSMAAHRVFTTSLLRIPQLWNS